ncbi:hypothetical protein [Cypionkella psychrotolerans]|uniref:hypothetical protein n=1 Tax=Cypionkella psychrotolerans TaxID=1678131 RepID=UPI0006B58F79|nr:hypothetical protein [Cypionkella psychrotolerans]
MSQVSAETLTLHVPMALRKHGRRKTIVQPEGAPIARRQIDNTMIKTLARAFRWRRILELGTFATITELAAAEKIDPSYLSRVLRLNNLAPDIVEAIVEGRQIGGATMAMLLNAVPAEWGQQHRLFALNT